MSRLVRLFVPLIVCVLPACRGHYLPTAAEPQNYRMSAAQDGPHSVDSLIAPYKIALDARMNAVIGTVARTLPKSKSESLLGNWVADALMVETALLTDQPPDACVQNYGGLRIPELPAGPLTLGKLYELMPFDNMQVIVAMDGIMVQRFFDHVAADGGWPVSEQVRFVLQDGKAARLTLDGQAPVADRVYRIGLPDYIADGGGDCDFLRDLPRENTGRLVRDLLIRHVERLSESGREVTGGTAGRILEW